MKSLLLLCIVLTSAVTLSTCYEDTLEGSGVTDCPNCNEWVGIGVGLGVSFLVVVILLALTIVTVVIVKSRKRRIGYEEFK